MSVHSFDVRVFPETRILLIGFFRATEIMIHVPVFVLARHCPVAALAERKDRCKAEPQGSAAVFNRRRSGRREWFCSPSSRCASIIQIVRPLESIAEIEPQLDHTITRRKFIGTTALRDAALLSGGSYFGGFTICVSRT